MRHSEAPMRHSEVTVVVQWGHSGGPVRCQSGPVRCRLWCRLWCHFWNSQKTHFALFALSLAPIRHFCTFCHFRHFRCFFIDPFMDPFMDGLLTRLWTRFWTLFYQFCTFQTPKPYPILEAHAKVAKTVKIPEKWLKTVKISGFCHFR